MARRRAPHAATRRRDAGRELARPLERNRPRARIAVDVDARDGGDAKKRDANERDVDPDVMGKHDSKPDDATSDDAKASGEVKTEMVPLSAMFRFYEPVDVTLLAAGALFSALGGALFPAVNVAFGNMLDSTAVGDVGSKINNAVIAMEIVAVSLGLSLTLGYWFTSWGAARAARNMRRAFVRAMLAQDINFFESKKAGELATLTGATVNDFQTGMSKKFAELIQSGFSMAGGFGVGFYFNAELSGVILATVPLLGFATFFPDQVDSRYAERERGVRKCCSRGDGDNRSHSRDERVELSKRCDESLQGKFR